MNPRKLPTSEPQLAEPDKSSPMITELEFKSLASQGYNRIPLMLEAFADLETPLSLYLKLAHSKDGGKYSFLLESVVGGERFGRYSFIGLPARTLVRASGFGAEAKTEVVRDGQVVETAAGNPLDFIEQYQKRFKVALRPGLPRFCGGLAGYFGYDAVRYIEKKLETTCPPDTLGTPDILLLQCEELAVIDNLSGKLYLIVYADPAQPEAYANAKKRLRDLKDLLKYSVSAPVVKASQTYPAERDFAKEDYLRAVEQAKELIAAGDFMQVQVGQRIKKRYTESPLCSTVRCARSTPAPTCTSTTSATSMSSGPAPRFWCVRSTRQRGRKSPSARSPAPARAVPPPRRTRPPKPNCWPTPRSVPSM